MEIAVGAFERALSHEASFPNVQTQAWAAYGVAIVLNKLTSLFDSAEKLARSRLTKAIFPEERYWGHAILAIINQYRRNLKAAVEHARSALAQVEIEYSGFSRHPDVGLVKNPDEELIAELKEIALL